jgi:hypothetical protein
MSVDNITFFATHPGYVFLRNFDDTVTVTVDIRDTDMGKFVVLARVSLENLDGDQQSASARLTTFDGKKELDRVDLWMPGAANNQAVSLQGVLDLGQRGTEPIIELRCATYRGRASQASLFVIAVDDLKFAGI